MAVVQGRELIDVIVDAGEISGIAEPPRNGADATLVDSAGRPGYNAKLDRLTVA